ncbi:MAG: hypothetical protein ACM3RX_00595, partial [Methanococcaceae archaeon]
MWIIGSLVLVGIITLAYEYRLRKPDQLVLFESGGRIIERKSRFFPRHFSLAMPNTTHSAILSIETAVKGNLDIKIRLSISVAASKKNIPALVRVGGWNSNAVVKSAKELEIILQSLIKKYVEKFEIEELSSERIYDYLQANVYENSGKLGLEVISLTVQSF